MDLTNQLLQSQPTLVYSAVAVFSYTLLCRALRYRRLNSLRAKYKYGTPSHPSFSGMTDSEAYEFLRGIAELEFPALFEKGLQLALFRTYGIPSISKLLAQTTQLTASSNVGKRYADTTVLICEIYGNAPGVVRGYEAFARLNYLHGHYIRQGKITNDDMLYTLALFMNHPVEWINRYEWRKLSDIEVCALGTFHKSMGDKMEISYDVLPGSKIGWKDGLQFYAELDAWAKQYEAERMVPDDTNHKTALKTQELLLGTVPRFTHGMVSDMISAAMDDRLRLAIKFPAPSAFAVRFLSVFMSLRAFVLRHFALPRPHFLRSLVLSQTTEPDGTRWITKWTTTPHYVKPTIWNRWGPSGWFQLLIGGPRPGDTGMRPEGYRTVTVGPTVFEGKGETEYKKTIAKLKEQKIGGCPFAVRG